MGEIDCTISGRLVTIVIRGEYPAEALLKSLGGAIDRVAGESRAGCLVLIDARTSTANRATTEVREMGHQAAKLAARIDRLAVVTASAVHHGLSRMALSIAELGGLSSIACKSMADACAFLGIDAPDTEGGQLDSGKDPSATRMSGPDAS